MIKNDKGKQQNSLGKKKHEAKYTTQGVKSTKEIVDNRLVCKNQ